VITRSPRLVRGALAAAAVAAVVVLAAAAPFAGTALIVSAPLSSPDAIVSLASHEWERLPEAAAQAKRYPRAVVVLTVPQVVSEVNCHDCSHRVDRLVHAGVDLSRIRMVPLTQGGTYGEAVATRAFIRDHHLGAVLVVTSPYHTRRSLATFRKALEATGASVGVAPAIATSPAQPLRWWAAAYDRAYVRYEWAAVVYYRLRYGVPLAAPDAGKG
jgi:uncharacterized SAM-binding protein YcdF (DUF218 family)